MSKIDELVAKIKDDAGVKAKFEACKNVDDVIALAKEIGLELAADDIEKLTDISAADLKEAAGGGLIKSIPRLTFGG